VDLGADVGERVAPAGCQQAQRNFVPKIPAVFLLVDRSDTMFNALPAPTPQQAGAQAQRVSAWSALRTGVLDVMQELQDSVRFGFGAFTGQNAAPACMFDMQSVAPNLDNFAAISKLYLPLEKPTNPQDKETPTVLALTEAAKQLRQDTSEGDKYILFVTDGEPDYCDDGNRLCPPDSVVGLLQNMAAGVGPGGTAVAPIHTLVFGITSPDTQILPAVLQGFANAGAGQAVAPLTINAGQTYDPNSVYDQCNGVAGWSSDFTATGKPKMRGQTIGTYAADATLGGSAPVYRPDPSDQAALTEQFRTALAGVKSCTFDLGEDGVKVDLKRDDLGDVAHVNVNGQAVPFDPANGWSMSTETTVQLQGAACTAWRTPTLETSITFDFPCDIFIPR